MAKRERNVQTAAPILFPVEPKQYWQMLCEESRLNGGVTGLRPDVRYLRPHQ